MQCPPVSKASLALSICLPAVQESVLAKMVSGAIHGPSVNYVQCTVHYSMTQGHLLLFLFAHIIYFWLLWLYRRLGEAQPGNRLGSVVLVYVRSGSEVGIGENSAGPTFPFFLLPCQDGISFEFCVVLVNPGEI